MGAERSQGNCVDYGGGGGIESKRGICDEPRRNVENKVREIRPCVLNYSPKQYVKVLTSDPVNMTLFGSRVFANVIKM